MYYAEVKVDEPLDKLLGDWDLLDERVIKKLTTFKEIGENVFGVRRRMVVDGKVLDPLKGELPQQSPDHHGLAHDTKRDRLLFFSDLGKNKGGTEYFIIEQESYQGKDPLDSCKTDLEIMKKWGY